MDCGVVVTVRLSPDYPRSSGGAVVEALTGVDGFRDRDLTRLRDELNATQWGSLGELFDVLEARLEFLATQGR